MSMLELRPTLALVALLTVGTGCMVGPEYQKPPVSVADAWIDTNPG